MKAVVFDLDGVLIDSLPNMKMAWEVVRQQHDIDIPFSEYEKQIGKPFFDILTNIGITEKQKEIKLTYNEASHMGLDEIEIYPNAIDTLKELKERGYKIAICTSKDYDRVINVFASLILDGEKFPRFDYICYPQRFFKEETVPDQLLYTIAHLNIDPKDAFFVGDMQSDKDCAERAGVKFIHAKYGFGELECEHYLNQLSDLTKLLD